MVRRLIAVMVAAAALVLGAAPAMASSAPTQTAIAFWDTGDALSTRVSLQASQTGATDSLFLFVTQSYCDTATDELVFRSFFGGGDISPQAFTPLPNLKGARLSVTTTVSGSEQRVANCASPDWNTMTFTNLGTSTITLQGNWVGTGSTYEVQPGITGRTATATGSITGTVLNIGSLGTADNAELRVITQQ